MMSSFPTDLAAAQDMCAVTAADASVKGMADDALNSGDCVFPTEVVFTIEYCARMDGSLSTGSF